MKLKFYECNTFGNAENDQYFIDLRLDFDG